ncbi:MAG: peptidylprolyl isomerase [Pirellulales bacterium]
MRFITTVGNIDIRLNNALAPNSVANFLSYVNSNSYNGTFVHRVPQKVGGGTSHFVVQGGGFLLNNSIFAATGITTNAPIGDEPNISNQRGTIAFAKNSLGATSQWFFNVGNNSFLDSQGFTVFGRVVGNGMTIVDMIDNMATANYSAAQNAQGEDFDEIPVKDLQKVNNQHDITNSDAVVITSVIMRPIPPGDYDFNGKVEAADFTVWKNTLGSTTNVAADGNGNGIVDAADYTVWRNTLGKIGGAGAIDALAVPEPGAILLVLSAAAFWLLGCLRFRSR